MRRLWLCLGTMLMVGMWAGVSWSQVGGPGGGTGGSRDEEKERYYVLAEVRGFDVRCGTYSSLMVVNQRVAELKLEAAQTTQANAVVNKELGPLRKKEKTLESAIKREKDQEKKTKLETELADVQTQIKAKEASLKPVVKWTVSRAFSKQADVDAFIAQINKDAEAARQRAEKSAAKDE